MIFFRGEY
jgi:hypothetical protein